MSAVKAGLRARLLVGGLVTIALAMLHLTVFSRCASARENACRGGLGNNGGILASEFESPRTIQRALGNMVQSPSLMLADFTLRDDAWAAPDHAKDSKQSHEMLLQQAEKERRLVFDKWLVKFDFGEAKASGKDEMPVPLFRRQGELHRSATWKYYTGILRTEKVSGGSCILSDFGKTAEVEIALNVQANPSKTVGYISQNGIKFGRFEGGESRLPLTYAFADGNLAKGHWIQLPQEQGGRLTASINEKALARNVEGCNGEISILEGELKSVGDVARSRFASLANKFDQARRESLAEKCTPALLKEYRRLDGIRLAIEAEQDAESLLSIRLQLEAIVQKLFGPKSEEYSIATAFLGKAYLDLGDAESALAHANQSLKIVRSPYSFGLRFLALRALKRAPEALATLNAWDNWLAKTPWDTHRIMVADTYLDLLGEALQEGKHKEALSLLHAALAVDIRHRPLAAANELGWIMALQLKRGHMLEARKSFGRALAIVTTEANASPEYVATPANLAAFPPLHKDLGNKVPMADACRKFSGAAPFPRSLDQGDFSAGARGAKELRKPDPSILPYLYCTNGFDSDLSSFVIGGNVKHTFDIWLLAQYDAIRPDYIGLAQLIALTSHQEYGLSLRSDYYGKLSPAKALDDWYRSTGSFGIESYGKILDKIVELDNDLTDFGKTLLYHELMARYPVTKEVPSIDSSQILNYIRGFVLLPKYGSKLIRSRP